MLFDRFVPNYNVAPQNAHEYMGVNQILFNIQHAKIVQHPLTSNNWANTLQTSMNESANMQKNYVETIKPHSKQYQSVH